MPAELLESPVEAVITEETHASAKKPMPNGAKTVTTTILGRATQGQARNWLTTSFMIFFHVLAVAALFFFSWKAVAVAAILYVFAINMGIGMGYHRLLTHRGYTTPKWIEYFLAICGTLALEGGPMFWVATHRIHHQITDRPGDPTKSSGRVLDHLDTIARGGGLSFRT